jgi:hypothetical protein
MLNPAMWASRTGVRPGVFRTPHQLRRTVCMRMAGQFPATTSVFGSLTFSATAPTGPYLRWFRATTDDPSAELFGTVRSALINLLTQDNSSPTIGHGQAVMQPAPVPGPSGPAPSGPAPSGPAPSGGSAGWADEGAWEAVNPAGMRLRPAPCPRLWRSCDEGAALFLEGMPAPGDNFAMVAHQRRSGSRDGTDDAFYGACAQARYEPGEGPLFGDGRYLVLLVDAYGVQVEPQPSEHVEIIEYETLVHMVPPWKIVAVLDKQTGVVELNPAAVARGVVTAEEQVRLQGVMQQQYQSYRFYHGFG